MCGKVGVGKLINLEKLSGVWPMNLEASIRDSKIFDQAAEEVSPEHWIWDGVHPLPQGHELIARNWLQAVSQATNK